MNKIKQIAELPIPQWHRIAKAVYSSNGIAPTIHCCGGGNMKPMILVRKDNNAKSDKGDRETANTSTRQY